MSKILVFCGTAQAGKSSSAKYVSGLMLKQGGVCPWFEVHDETGDLYIQANTVDEQSNVKPAVCKLDLYRQDFEFQQYAAAQLWPHAKIYSYANALKRSLNEIFGLHPQNLYGSNDDKNQPTQIKWENIKKLLPKTKLKQDGEFITHRQAAQVFGEVCRMIDNDCWVERCFAEINMDQYPHVMIDDCRYENEIEVAKKYGAKIVLLTKNPLKMDHASEKILEVDRSKFDYIIDNDGKFSIKDKEKQIYDILIKEGWITASL